MACKNSGAFRTDRNRYGAFRGPSAHRRIVKEVAVPSARITPRKHSGVSGCHEICFRFHAPSPMCVITYPACILFLGVDPHGDGNC